MSGGGVIFQELVSGGGYRRGRATLTHAFETPKGVGGYIYIYIYIYILGAHASPPTPINETGEIEYKGALGAKR